MIPPGPVATPRSSDLDRLGAWMAQSPQAAASAIVRALRFAPVWFLAAMASPETARFALPLLVLIAAWAAWRGDLDLASNLDAIEWGVFIFAAAWIASAFFGLDPARSFRLSIPMLAALTSLFVLRRQREAAQALSAFDVALFLLGFWQCLQVARSLLAGLAGEAAVQNSDAMWLVEPNDIGWVAATWPPLFGLWTGRGRVLLAVPIALALVLMIALGSRLALIVSVVALAPMLARGTLKMLVLALAMAAVLVVVASLVDPGILAKGSASLATRMQLWQTAWQVFFDWPWMGTGPHGFELAYRQYLPEAVALDPRDTPWPHSLPLEIAAVTGLAGIFASGLLIFAAILHYRTEATYDTDRRRILLVQCAAFALLGLFEASFLRLWVWMLATSILCRLARHAPGLSDFSLTKGGNQ
jgi:O-antigen ligase